MSQRKVRVVETYPHLYQPEALKITVDGKRVQVTGRWRRMRDGGTSILPTDAGELRRPAPRLNQAATLGGEVIDLEWVVKHPAEGEDRDG
jgi:hypothetical protein